MSASNGSIVLLSSPGMSDTAGRIVHLLQKSGDYRFCHCEVSYTTFKNGEIKPKILETVRSKKVYFLHDMQDPDPNIAVMKLLLVNDALKRASVTDINLVLPYMPYLRQDRKDESRVPISARLLADVIETNHKVERIITLDMHADQEQGFFNIPVDNLYGMMVLAEYFKKKYEHDFSNIVVVAPDFGSAVRARRFAKRLGPGVPVVIIEKRRSHEGVETLGSIGSDLKGKDAIVFDDMIDSGGTNVAAANFLYAEGVKNVVSAATHGLFSADAVKKLGCAGLEVVVTPSIPRSESFKEKHASWVSFASIDELLAEAIKETSIVGGSISKLFE